MYLCCERETVFIACVLAALAVGAVAQGASPHHEFLGGPWEVMVKMGHEGAALRLPLTVSDENKAQTLDAVLPVMGTPFKVKLDQYVPDLKWETTAVADPNGGPVAKLSLRGENLTQDLWLSARDRERQSISSHIGGIGIRELAGQRTADLLQGLGDRDVVGVLLVWLSDSDSPVACAVRPGQPVDVPGSPWKVSISRYVPHYSIDRETKEVTNLSDRPVNPAIEIVAEGDQETFRQWLWSQFPSSPHKLQRLPFRARFMDFHVDAGQYMIVVPDGSEPRLLSVVDGQKRIERIESGRRYPFADERYSFAVEEVRRHATINTQWKNGSEMLLRPAVVATVVESGSTREVVLEPGKPYHHQARAGTLVVLYRRVP